METNADNILSHFIEGVDTFILIGWTVMVWGTTYAIIALTNGNVWHTAWVGVIIAIFGLCGILSILIDYINHRFGLKFYRFNLYAPLLFILLFVPILLSVYGIIPSYIFLEPLDYITDNIFYVLIIPPITREAYELIRTKKSEDLTGLRLNATDRYKLAYLLLSIPFAVAYGILAALYASTNQLLGIIIIILPIPLLALLLYTSLKNNIILNDYGFMYGLLMHIGAFLVLILFFYRAWEIYHGKGHAEILEVVATSAILVTGILQSANRLSNMKFASSFTVSRYIFGLTALGIGGVVIAVIITNVTNIGEFTVDAAMMRLYAAHIIGIGAATIVSVWTTVITSVKNIFIKKIMGFI